VKNCQDPEFSTKLHIDYYFEKVQKLKFGVYDIDNKSVDLKDDDFLGGFECTLGQVWIVRSETVKCCFVLIISHTVCIMALFVHQPLQQIVSSRKITRPLQLKETKPAGKGTITVCSYEHS